MISVQHWPFGWFRGLTARLIALNTVLTIVILAIVVPGTYKLAVFYKERELGERLKAIAASGAPFIRGDEVVELTHLEKSASPAFRNVRGQLLKIQMANKLDADLIYTLVPEPNGRDDTMIFGAMLHAKPFTGDSYPKRSLMNSALLHGKPVSTGLYHDEHGHWISAYAPITHGSGEVVGILEVDFHADQVFAEAMILSAKIATIIACILLAAFVVYILVFTRLIRPFRDLARLGEYDDVDSKLKELLAEDSRTDEMREIASVILKREVQLKRQLSASIDQVKSNASVLLAHSGELGSFATRLRANLELYQKTGVAVQQLTGQLENSASDCVARSESWSQSVSQFERNQERVLELATEFEGTLAPIIHGVSESELRYQSSRNLIRNLSGINRQTRLLALNSSIEARRSGDNNCFVTIAEELGDLASGVEEATRQVNTELDTLASLTRESGDGLNNVLSNTNSIVSQLTRSLADMSRLATTSERLLGTLKSLSNELGELHSTVDIFKSNSQELSSLVEDIIAASELLATQFESLDYSVAPLNSGS